MNLQASGAGALLATAAFALGVGAAYAADGRESPVTEALRREVRTIVVIYADNRAFDNLYGNFPGARGLREVVDRDGLTGTTALSATSSARSKLSLHPAAPTQGG